jgi:RNA polymerase sigma-70 factor (ECF subfamily)
MLQAMIYNLPAEDREDIVQDILITIHSKSHTWKEDHPVLPWIYAIARHRIIDFGRAQSRQHRHVPIDEVAEIELSYSDSESLVGIESQINQLGGKLGKVARCLGLEGKSIAETSSLLGMSENAVRIAFHRALKKLRTH